MRLAALLVAVLATLAVCACGGSGATAAPTGGAAMVDASGDWVLESGVLDGVPIPLVAGSPVTMTVEGTQVGGTSACNGYGTSVGLIDGRLQFDEWSSTAMLCEDEVMASETAFVAAMTRVTAAARDGDTLVLTGDDVELRFIPVEPLPIGDIVDRVWALESIVEDGATRPAGGEPATVEYRPDGTFSGSTGCRSFTGRWLESQARIVATEMSMDQLDCPPELADQDGLVTTVVGQAQASVEGDALRLMSRGDLGLVYRLLGDT